MKTYDELVERISGYIIEDEKRGIKDTLRNIDFGLITWIYDIEPHKLYIDIIEKKGKDDGSS